MPGKEESLSTPRTREKSGVIIAPVVSKGFFFFFGKKTCPDELFQLRKRRRERGRPLGNTVKRKGGGRERKLPVQGESRGISRGKKIPRDLWRYEERPFWAHKKHREKTGGGEKDRWEGGGANLSRQRRKDGSRDLPKKGGLLSGERKQGGGKGKEDSGKGG